MTIFGSWFGKKTVPEKKRKATEAEARALVSQWLSVIHDKLSVGRPEGEPLEGPVADIMACCLALGREGNGIAELVTGFAQIEWIALRSLRDIASGSEFKEEILATAMKEVQ